MICLPMKPMQTPCMPQSNSISHYSSLENYKKNAQTANTCFNGEAVRCKVVVATGEWGDAKPPFTFGTGPADHFIRLCIRQMYLHVVINCRTSEYETCRCHIDVHVSSCNNVRPHLPRMHYQKYQNVYQQMHSRKYADFSLLHTNTNMYRPLFSATR